MHANAEHQPFGLGLVRLALGHRLLELDGGRQRFDSARELEQGGVARELDHAAAAANQNGLQTLGPVPGAAVPPCRARHGRRSATRSRVS